MKEHYHIDIPVSAVRVLTQGHARVVESIQQDAEIKAPSAKKRIVAQTDGCFIPMVETGLELAPEEKDARKKRKVSYKEVRLSLAHELESKDIHYAGTIESVDQAGKQLLGCVKRVGYDQKTQVHCVGDGATWIAYQVEEHFGSRGTYLIDFYHLCEYLAAAAMVCAPSGEKSWLGLQKTLMKQSRADLVLNNLRSHLEHSSIPDKEAPVRVCYRYINNRLHQLDYKYAIEQNLPIGSGEIESAHRYVVQRRLKIPGAAWKPGNANSMLALRTCRANNDWEGYWQKAA